MVLLDEFAVQLYVVNRFILNHSEPMTVALNLIAGYCLQRLSSFYEAVANNTDISPMFARIIGVLCPV